MQRILVPIMAVLAVLGGPAALLAASPPAAGAPVLVIARDAEAAVRRSGGQPIGPVRAPLGALATSLSPDFVQRLRDAGAWLVLDGRALAAICGGAA